MNLFNYFQEFKDKFKIPDNVFNSYNIINIGGELVYIEGQCGLIILGENIISFKLKKGRVEIKGNNLFLKVLTTDTAVIQGKIYKTEVF